MKRLLTLLLICTGYILSAQTPYGASSAEIFQGIKKLKVLGSVLYIGAHPDDENNSLLPYLAKEKMYRTAYLSLTRGDGGQNLIGSEQGIELGLIRTQELLAARKIDGAEQYFTSAYEFGFSKSSEEALRIWNREKLLSDMVWVIRMFQPDIIIKRFPGDGRAGHGHHAASAILADEAFLAAADPNRFPEQFRYGAKTWQAKRIFWNTFNFGGNNTTSDSQLKIDIGVYNPLIGKSYGEIGGEARTMHKSQGEGRPRRKGQIFEYFALTGGDSAKKDLFENINTSWSRLDNGEVIETQLNNITAKFNFEHPEASVLSLITLYKAIKAFPQTQWRDKKLQDTQELIEQCSGLFTEATTTQQFVTREDSVRVNFFINKRQDTDVKLLGIRFEPYDSVLNNPLAVNNNLSLTKTFVVPASKKLTQPYWLENEPKDYMFVVKDQYMVGKAENDPSFEAIYTISIEGETFQVHRPLLYKTVDPEKGELYQPVAILPSFEAGFDKENYVSLNGTEVPAMVRLRFNGANAADSKAFESALSPKVTGQWQILSKKNILSTDAHSIFNLKPLQRNNHKGEMVLPASNDIIYYGASKTITYDHIPSITYLAPARSNLVSVDIKTSGKNIGYIAGAGDKVPEALESLGLSVKFLNEADLTAETLKKFDAIVVGVRAYNIYEYLSNKNNVLNEYVYNGGNLIVQYLKSNLVGLKRVSAGPYSFSISAGQRVTEENAKVEFLLPDHPVLNKPNKITTADFENWVQERSTYQVDQADSHFEFPLGMNDTNEKQSKGSLAIAKYGRGNFAYVSLVMFRQLPAGIPGAYRLLANLIALPKNTNETGR